MDIDVKVLDQLYEKALESFDRGEIPVAAAIFDSKTDELISVMGNNRQLNCNVLGHAEINCILDVESKIKDWRLDGFYMVVTLEPCKMCSAVIEECRLDKVYYFLSNRSLKIKDLPGNKIKLVGYEQYEKKLNKLLTTFFDNMR